MGEVSSVGELLELAIGREIQAAEYLSKLAERMVDPATQALLEQLAQDELGHKAKLELELMKQGIVAQTLGRLVEVAEPEYVGPVDIDPASDVKRILALVIRKERRSFRFYVDLAGVALEGEVHEALMELAEEEARHLIRFEREYNKLTAQEK
ncbi:MAG: ferritin family protein [Sedimentisphaerales bacterium]|nr:ferritin family protein [Sedimentisphaerales bacterium]